MAPKYRINAQAPGAVIYGIGILPPGTEVELPEKIEPANSWIPLNEAAVARFEKRNKAVLDLAKTEGINGSGPMDERQLADLAKRLRWTPDRTPHLTSVHDEAAPLEVTVDGQVGQVVITKESDGPPPPPSNPEPLGAISIAPPKAPKAPKGQRASDS